jgi:hypothetical protein
MVFSAVGPFTIRVKIALNPADPFSYSARNQVSKITKAAQGSFTGLLPSVKAIAIVDF